MKTAIENERIYFASLFKGLKKKINSDTLVKTGDGLKKGIEVTIGYRYLPKTDELEWAYQTGDNSYTGAAYNYQLWVTATVMFKSNSAELAQEVMEEMDNTLATFLSAVES
jgi:hypothetical protein